MDYCRWLTDRLRETELAAVIDERYPQGWRVILPSELEWEYAARNCRTSSNIWPWGDAPDPNRANYSDSGVSRPSVVGCFPYGATEQGVEDMVGNVWEWTRSNYDRPNPADSQKRIRFDYPYNPDDDREQIDAPDDWGRTLRGGSFRYNYWYARVASRIRLNWYDLVGFRVAVCAYSS